MDRKKPKLTSPWKVGFLVALLLVVTALGVSYFITGTFGITWHWIQAGGWSPTTWKFHLGAFLEEMAPLLVITALLAFGAYVLVAGAVRRYKAYVDSGVEYKQLLKSIKSIEDLETDDIASRLKAHPELREFLVGFKHRIATMERQYSVTKHTPTSGPSREDRAALAAECATLASAIDGGRDQLPAEITLNIPELKQIERSLRRFFVAMPSAPVTDPSVAALEELRQAVRSSIESLRQDVIACGSGAREVETAAAALRRQFDDTPAKPAGNSAVLQKRIDAVAEALAALGEETKRIAIASAMQASGGPGADTIKIADELKTLATRFNTVSRHWNETTPALKELLAGGGSRGASADAPAAVANIANRSRLWGERTVAMNEHLRLLERVVGIASASRAAAVTETPSAAVDLDSPAPDAAPSLGAGSGDVTDVAGRSDTGMFAKDGVDDVSFADVPGFEKEHRFFADPPADVADVADDRFVVEGHQEKSWDLTEEQDADEQPAQPAAAKEPAHDSDGFLTGPRPTVSSQRVPRPAAQPAQRMAPTPVASAVETESVATATLDPDADAVDLYTLGAVDCVQTM